MKISVFHIMLVLYLFYGSDKFAFGQFFDDSSKHFQYIQMDLVHRGSFNTTDCLRDLLNCWEIIKPDYICSDWVIYESVCGLSRNYCTDGNETYENRDHVPLYESFCKTAPST